MTRRVVNQRAPLKSLVSASDLARMGLCERMVVLERRFGPRLSPARLAAADRGRRAHAQFLREGERAPGDEPRRPVVLRIAHCLVAKLCRAWSHLRPLQNWLRMLLRVR